MDRFGKDEFRQLLEVKQGPAVSLYMPIDGREEMTFKALKLTLRNLIKEAERKLESIEEFEPSSYQTLLARLETITDDRDFFKSSGDGLAIFLSAEVEEIYFLPLHFETTCVVGHTFHTRPLLEHIAAPTDYYVLAIGQNEVTFWEGSPTGVKVVEIDDLPTSMQEALQLESEPDQDGLNFRTGRGSSVGGMAAQNGSRTRGGLPSPIFHGHGGGQEERNAYLRQYFAKVSAGIEDYLGNSDGPLILAAVDFCHPIFKQVSKLNNLSEAGIVGNVHFWNDKSIYEKAWPIARQTLEKRQTKALQEWERAFGRGGAEIDPKMVGRRTIEGRIHRLLLDEDRRIWGHYDRTTGEITILPDDADEEARAGAVDVFDEIAETVIEHGGEVVVLPSHKMPGQTGIGAILRGQ